MCDYFTTPLLRRELVVSSAYNHTGLIQPSCTWLLLNWAHSRSLCSLPTALQQCFGGLDQGIWDVDQRIKGRWKKSWYGFVLHSIVPHHNKFWELLKESQFSLNKCHQPMPMRHWSVYKSEKNNMRTIESRLQVLEKIYSEHCLYSKLLCCTSYYLRKRQSGGRNNNEIGQDSRKWS